MSRETKLNLLSAAMDLKRVAVGYQNDSPEMAERFRKEALRWLKTIPTHELPDYLARAVKRLPRQLATGDQADQAETALTYSVIIQNYATAN
ncbi:MAG: hypothetical protein WD970_02010 [Patescibacteria group bacterium]